MQTFLPFDDLQLTAEVLDRQRLGKQRVEVMQILGALHPKSDKKGWANHPAVLMWQGYEGALAQYGVVICREWTNRGYKDTCLAKIVALADPDFDFPPWFGVSDLHVTHQSNLLRKNPAHYGPYFPNVPDDLEYMWPKGISSKRRRTSTSERL